MDVQLYTTAAEVIFKFSPLVMVKLVGIAKPGDNIFKEFLSSCLARFVPSGMSRTSSCHISLYISFHMWPRKAVLH